MKTHPREEKGSKRGAVELSMTTIIIVVIGITILTLGLRWIYGIFEDLGTSTDELQRLTKDQITEILGGSEDAINIPTSVIEGIKKGDNYKLRMVARNKYPETHRFRYDITVDSTPANLDTQLVRSNIIWTQSEIPLNSGEGFRDFILINTDSLPLGTYKIRISLSCIDCTPPQPPDSVPVIFEVALS